MNNIIEQAQAILQLTTYLNEALDFLREHGLKDLIDHLQEMLNYNHEVVEQYHMTSFFTTELDDMLDELVSKLTYECESYDDAIDIIEQRRDSYLFDAISVLNMMVH
jgi:uncharacterized protein Yka (UPF0111/DUF47 family)